MHARKWTCGRLKGGWEPQRPPGTGDHLQSEPHLRNMALSHRPKLVGPTQNKVIGATGVVPSEEHSETLSFKT